MLTRLRVSGFKNLVDVDVRFGPFTCIAGTNGSGKSNLFDAIRFLSLLAEHPLLKSAEMIRGANAQPFDVRELFFNDGKHLAREIAFIADIIIPYVGIGAFGEPVTANNTFLRYTLKLTLADQQPVFPIVVEEEQLLPISPPEALKSVAFAHSNEWYESVQWLRQIHGLHPDGTIIPDAYIKTDNGLLKLQVETTEANNVEVLPFRLSQTLLASANSRLNPTTYLTQQEMRSWRHILLEPSALRLPDSFADVAKNNKIGADGQHLPATLYNIANSYDSDKKNKKDEQALKQAAVYSRIANRLNNLIGDMQTIGLKVNEEALQISLVLTNRQGVNFSPRALSDGTLRFLAYAIMLEDYHSGVLCIEEPENGLHPQRIPALLRLLQDLAMDPHLPMERNNPLRQVIISTHSPLVVSNVPDDALVYVRATLHGRGHNRGEKALFQWLPGTWRATFDSNPAHIVARGDILNYAEPLERLTVDKEQHRVIDNAYISPFLQPSLIERDE